MTAPDRWWWPEGRDDYELGPPVRAAYLLDLDRAQLWYRGWPSTACTPLAQVLWGVRWRYLR